MKPSIHYKVGVQRIFFVLVLAYLVICPAYAQDNSPCTIKGAVIDQTTKHPVKFVNVILRRQTDSVIVTGIATDSAGGFALAPIPEGYYFITFRLIGYREKSTPSFFIDANHKHLNLGEVMLIPKSVKMKTVEVWSTRLLQNNGFEKKVYNVGQDMTGNAGSASDVLQNVPSLNVDIDGTVTLRGSSDVTIMIDGRTSPLMEKNSAIVLQEIPASSIERIEVMTNPSAKYKPEGTSGIINIITRKNTSPGINCDVGANTGNEDRYNANVHLNYNPGGFNIFGSYAIRKDNRNRFTTDNRRQVDSSSILSFYNQNLNSYSRPLSHLASLGIDGSLDDQNRIGLSGNFFHNGFTRTDNSNQVLLNTFGAPINRYNRDRIDYEFEGEFGFTGYAEHAFEENGHNLKLEFDYTRSPEQEDNYYTNRYNLPLSALSFDNTRITTGDNHSRITLDYKDPLSEGSTLEAGYSGEFNGNNFDYFAQNFDAGRNFFVTNTNQTNRFLYDESINAMYATFKQSFGAFGFEAGARVERAVVKSNLVTLDSIIDNGYNNLYPSLHLSYTLNPGAELQMSYSRRVHRPETEDINPFTDFRDPRNISVGNPTLLPEYIQSVELGCQFRNDLISILPSVYYHFTVNRFAAIRHAINDTLILTTHENFSNDQASGVEIVLSADLSDFLTVHWNANAFMEQIDAANLGYPGTKSIDTWSSALTLGVNLTGSSRMQIISTTNSSRLTPQGDFSPNYLCNVGFQQQFMDKQLTMVFTVTDIFKTMKRELALDTPWLIQDVVNTTDSRIMYFGLTYHFGISGKSNTEEQFHYDYNY
ncbi:MAG: TonB-dependent receptor domain-containing protein [Bacteroidota bacterium]